MGTRHTRPGPEGPATALWCYGANGFALRIMISFSLKTRVTQLECNGGPAGTSMLLPQLPSQI